MEEREKRNTLMTSRLALPLLFSFLSSPYPLRPMGPTSRSALLPFVSIRHPVCSASGFDSAFVILDIPLLFSSHVFFLLRPLLSLLAKSERAVQGWLLVYDGAVVVVYLV
jgi:hypothetical protein